MTALLTENEHERIFNKYYGEARFVHCCPECVRPLRIKGTTRYCPACEHKHSTFMGAENHA